MKILIIGGGGREHAIAQTLYSQGHTLWCAPGNAGIEEIATRLPIKATEIEKLTAYAADNAFDLVVVAPDDPLALGLVDTLRAKGIRAFGPTASAARIESSKSFCKTLLQKYHIPTARFKVCDAPQQALDALDAFGLPVVVKADGLALGKGVYICHTREEAEEAIREMMVRQAFGKAGRRVLLEEYMEGPEVSFLCFCDGTHVAPMPAAQDHKRAFDGDQGPNTGGMGAFAPTPTFPKALQEQVLETIVLPTVRAMQQERALFQGVLYCGLMLTKEGPKVLEYNARFGDPETQAILPLLESDLAGIFLATIDGSLDQCEIQWKEQAAVCIVLASGGYPREYQTGYPIAGLEEAKALGAQVFHAGTAKQDGSFVTAGGRVLGVVQRGETLDQAILKGYQAVEKIRFENMHFRTDIGRK